MDRNRIIGLGVVTLLAAVVGLASSGAVATTFSLVFFVLRLASAFLSLRDLNRRGTMWKGPLTAVAWIFVPIAGFLLYAAFSLRPRVDLASRYDVAPGAGDVIDVTSEDADLPPVPGTDPTDEDDADRR